MERTEAGVCVPGFRAAGIKEGKYGLAVILSEEEANCALMVTDSKVRAAPIRVSLDHARKKRAWGIMANSGNANSFTGEEGYGDALEMSALAAGTFGHAPEDYIINSTGVIGRKLDLGIIKDRLGRLPTPACSPEASMGAAKAIMTTDTVPKMYSVKTTLKSGEVVHVGGIAKGAGMMAPKLAHATTFCFITTDAYIPPDRLDGVLGHAVEMSLNMAMVDNDRSTNDMVCLLANGMAGNKEVDGNLQEALDHVCTELARMLVKDGEGATKYFEVLVKSAPTEKDARLAARAVAGSMLVKSAIFGGDPNWGRVIAALGYSGAQLEPERISLYVRGAGDEVCLVEKGRPLAFQGTPELKAAERVMKGKEIFFTADLAMGDGVATAFGCDLTYDYVKINAEYTT